MTPPLDVLTMGRVGVDIYPLQVGVGLEEVTAFGGYLGGSATNVAVAAPRLGRRSAVITRTGDDPFGRFIHAALRGYGVDYRFARWRRWRHGAKPGSLSSTSTTGRHSGHRGRRRGGGRRRRWARPRSRSGSWRSARPRPANATPGAPGWDTTAVMRFANAAGGIVASRLACAEAMPTISEVQAVLTERSDVR